MGDTGIFFAHFEDAPGNGGVAVTVRFEKQGAFVEG